MSRAARAVLWATTLLAAFTCVLMVGPRSAGGAESTSPPREDTRNVVSFGRTLTIDRPVSGSVQVILGSVELNSTVAGDLAVFGGNITFGPRARVTGDVVSFGGTVNGVEPARVGGELISFASNAPRIKLGSGAGSVIGTMYQPFSLLGIALKLALLVGWIAAAIILSLTNGRELRASSIELRVSPFHSFALGLVAFTSFVLTAIIFSYLVPYLVGIPLLFVLGVFAMLAKIYGMVAVFHAVGWMIAGPRTIDQIRSRRLVRGDMGMVLLGIVALGAVRLIPVVGNFVWIGASLFGVGVALATKFGRREPWFLVWQPAES